MIPAKFYLTHPKEAHDYVQSRAVNAEELKRQIGERYKVDGLFQIYGECVVDLKEQTVDGDAFHACDSLLAFLLAKYW